MRPIHKSTVRTALISGLSTGAIIAAGVGCAGPAIADPGFGFGGGIDPHIPQPLMGYCPGGGAGGDAMWCDGQPYPDGTKWHGFYYGGTRSMTCVIDDGGPMPPPAPPGGCGGAW